jgi:plastocyanin
MRKLLMLAVAALAFTVTPAAGAATITISITKSGFTPSAATATTADTVQFSNTDTVAHQVAFKPTAGVTCSPSPFTLQPAQSGTCTFATAGAIAISDPTATGTTFQGTVTVTTPPAPDTVSLFSDPQTVVYSGKVRLTGEFSGKQTGLDVAVLATPCGRTDATRAATVQTTSGGEYVVDLRTARNTVYTVQVKGATSSQVGVKVGPRLRLGRLGAHRYSLRVFAAQSFAGKYATFQRLSGSRWISVKRVRLQRNPTHILPTVVSSVAFRWTSAARPRVRAILPAAQAGSCYLPGTSNDIRS